MGGGLRIKVGVTVEGTVVVLVGREPVTRSRCLPAWPLVPVMLWMAEVESMWVVP